MKSNKNNSTVLVVIIGVLVVMLAASIGYIVGNNTTTANYKNVTAKPQTKASKNNRKIIAKVQELKEMYDTKIAEKTISFNELQLEKSKVENLVTELEKTKKDAAILAKYKSQFKSLEHKMQILVTEIVVLKDNKRKYVNPEKIIYNDGNQRIIASKEIPTKKNNGIAKTNQTVSKADAKKVSDDYFFRVTTTDRSKEIPESKPVKITVSSVRMIAINSKSASKQPETNEANKANLIKIFFNIDENSNARSENKIYYIQIINSKGQVMGRKITEFFDNESVTYSFSKSFDYNSESVQAMIDFPVSNLEKGNFTVNIYDRSELVGKSVLILK